MTPTYHTTSPSLFRAGIRFELCRFHSPLLTVSQLIFPPAPTKMFQFRAFPILTDRLKKSREFSLGRPRFTGSLYLPEAFRNLARPSSALEPSHPLNGIITNFFPPPSSLDVRVAKCVKQLHLATAICSSLKTSMFARCMCIYQNGLAGI